jgi:alpha-tubulin suppressor-like RCC1 family protein
MVTTRIARQMTAEAARRNRGTVSRAGVVGLALLVTGEPAGPAASAAAGAVARSGAATALAAGSLRAWGDDLSGQLGDGGSVSRSTPVAVMLPAGTAVKAVAAGGRHTLAVTRSGELLAWGYNFDGQLGDGTTTGRRTPVRVTLPGGAKVVAVAAGSSHSLAVTTAGKVLAWGSNEYGQLGDGTTTDRHRPVAVRLPAGTRVVAVSACYNYSVALTSAGRVLAWGHNHSGQLGDGSRRSSHVPVRVKLPAGVKVTAIAAGGYQTLALTSAGRPCPVGARSAARKRVFAAQRHARMRPPEPCAQVRILLGALRNCQRKRRPEQQRCCRRLTAITRQDATRNDGI